MRRHGDIMASVGEYTDAQGRKAKRWIRCGVLMRDDTSGALAIKLDAVPVLPTWSGWLAVRNVGAAIADDDAEGRAGERMLGDLAEPGT